MESLCNRGKLGAKIGSIEYLRKAMLRERSGCTWKD